MAQRKPERETLSITEVRSNLGPVTNEVRGGDARVDVEKSGITLQGIISIEDLQRLKRFRAQRRKLQDVRERMREAFKDVSEEELWRETERIVSEDRQRLREEKAAAHRALGR